MNDKMFRSKPYTKCINCLSSEQIKCKKCMNKLIDTISQFQNINNLKRLHIKNQRRFRIRNLSSQSDLNNILQNQPKKFSEINQINSYNQQNSLYNNSQKKHHLISLKKSQNLSNKQKIPSLIKNKYQMWMNQVKTKNQNHFTYRNWPKKSIVLDWALINTQNSLPKFQKWQKKLIDQLILKKTNRFQKHNSCASLDWRV